MTSVLSYIRQPPAGIEIQKIKKKKFGKLRCLKQNKDRCYVMLKLKLPVPKFDFFKAEQSPRVGNLVTASSWNNK